MRAVSHIKADGTITPLKGAKVVLEEAQRYVGGYIEPVKYNFGRDIMLVNEEGLLEGLPVNSVASIMTQRHIVGDVLVVEYEKEDLE